MPFLQTSLKLKVRFSLHVFFFILMMVSALVSCSRSADRNPEGPSTGVPLSALKLAPSADCDDLAQYVEAALIERYTMKAPPACTDCPLPLVPLGGDGAIAANTVLPEDVTRTNTQEEGVDEADLVEADSAGRLYIVNGGFLAIEKGFPPQQLAELSRLKLDTSAGGLYLDEARRRVVIFGRRFLPVQAQTADVSAAMPIAPLSYDEMIFVDVADPSQPRITQRLLIEGFQIDHRRIETRIHLVSRFRMPEPEALMKDNNFSDLVNRYRDAVWNGTGRAEEAERIEQLKEAIRQTIRKAMTETDVRTLLPRASRQIGGTEAAVALLSCRDVLLPEVKEDLGLLIVTSVDTDGSNLSATALINNAWLTYADKEHLYVAQLSSGWWWDSNQPPQTALYKFGISEEKPAYLAAGRIDGWIGSRFHLSEQEGFLRVVSTEDRIDPETKRLERKNHLFVLEENPSGELQVAGSVLGFAPGEQVTGARFLGDRGYVVTFRQVDPLFAFDLSDPRQPKRMGELTIPGFSTYLHPLGPNHLLTIGLESGDIQLQIFDVADPARPALLHKYLPAGGGRFGWSQATFDPHAFTFYAPRNLLAIPLVVWDPPSGTSFSGVAAFRVSVTEGFTELGRVDQADLAFQVYCTNIPPDQPWIADECKEGRFLGGAAPTRSVMMASGPDTFLYSLSNVGVKATPIDQPASVLGSVLLPDPGYGWWMGVAAAAKPSVPKQPPDRETIFLH
ncbi:MAG: hypothetical protein EPO39_16865 [Candidatus Manganitrophaceae bacterium]|nr:MAG: hypothetical protein EPO39_16865 [Candidatus Manganitrophaceae bacterium]